MDIETLPEKKVDVNDVSEVSLRDIYMRLCTCRDFEIKLQWERSVFLTAFLIACFAGYGSFLLSVHQNGIGNLSPLVVKGIPLVITFVGIVLSLFWIFMAKGSKAWYEHYEKAIASFAINNPVANANVTKDMMSHIWRKMKDIKRDSMSNCYLSLYGGAYSVSKIVIAIGISAFVIWNVLFLLHLGLVFWGPMSGWEIFKGWDYLKNHKCLVFGMMAIVSIVVLPLLLALCLKSKYLKKVSKLSKDEED